MNRCLPGGIFHLALAASVLIALCLAGCHRPEPRGTERGKKPVPVQQPEKSKIEARFKGARMIWSDEQGRKLWEAGFREALASQGDETEVRLLGVKATLYRDGKAASTLIAPKVAANSRTKEVRASGGVKVISASDGTTANVRELVWRAREDRLTGTGGVGLSRENMLVSARSFDSDTGLSKLVLHGAEMTLE